METLHLVWSSVKEDPEKNAIALIKWINEGLNPENHLKPIKISDNWWGIAGNDKAKKFFDEIIAQAKADAGQ